MRRAKMAKKNDPTDFDLDADLDFDFDSELSGDPFNQASSKGKRGVITDVASGVLEGVVSQATSPSFLKQKLREVMPKNYVTVTEGLGEVTGTVYDLYDHTAKELKPRLGSIARKIDQ